MKDPCTSTSFIPTCKYQPHHLDPPHVLQLVHVSTCLPPLEKEKSLRTQKKIRISQIIGKVNKDE